MQIVKNPRNWLVLLLTLHILLAIYFFPPSLLTLEAPIQRADYATHFYDAYAVSQSLQQGHSWGYDPFFMAGYPVGTVFDVDNKMGEVFVFALRSIGIPRAFNLFVLLLFLGLPLFSLLTARNLDLGWREQAIAVALTVLTWYLDPSIATMRHVGMFSFAAVSYLSPWVISLLVVYRRRGTVWSWLRLTVALAAIIWLHMLAFLILIIPMGLYYLLNWKNWGIRRHLALFTTALCTILINLYWLEPLARFRHILTDSATYFAGGIGALFSDLFQAGVAEGSEFPRVLVIRWTVFALAIVALASARWQDRRAERWVFLSGIAWSFLLAYFAALVPMGTSIEPYRFVAPATLLAVFPAAIALGDATWWNAISTSPRAVKLGMIPLVLALVLGLLSAGYALHPRVERLWTTVTLDDQLHGPTERQSALLKWVKKNTEPNTRILIQDWWTAALVPYFTGRQVIGGPYHPYFIQHAYANLGGGIAFGEKISDISPADLNEILRTYNVGWIIVNPQMVANRASDISLHAERGRVPFINLVDTVGGFRIYRIGGEPSFFLRGSGQVEANYNVLRVHAASPGSVVLKYHWLDTLKSDPPLELEPYPVLDDPVGFIQVKNGQVTDFVVYNGY